MANAYRNEAPYFIASNKLRRGCRASEQRSLRLARFNTCRDDLARRVAHVRRGVFACTMFINNDAYERAELGVHGNVTCVQEYDAATSRLRVGLPDTRRGKGGGGDRTGYARWA